MLRVCLTIGVDVVVVVVRTFALLAGGSSVIVEQMTAAVRESLIFVCHVIPSIGFFFFELIYFFFLHSSTCRLSTNVCACTSTVLESAM